MPLTEWLQLYFTDAPNLAWLMKIFMDALVSCRCINCVLSVDDYTESSLTINVAFRISDVQVTYILDSIMLLRGYLVTI